MEMNVWLVLLPLLIIASAVRYGECKKEGHKGYYYLGIMAYLIGTLIFMIK